MSVWDEIDKAKAKWDSERRKLDDRLIEAGVKARIRNDLRVQIVTVGEHGELVVDLGSGVRITALTAATLLDAVPGGLARLKAERLARGKRRKAVLAAREDRAEERERGRS